MKPILILKSKNGLFVVTKRTNLSMIFRRLILYWRLGPIRSATLILRPLVIRFLATTTAALIRFAFQVYCHIQRSSESELEHHEFLFDANADPREVFINEMLKVLPSSGSIVVYHQTYEMTKLKELASDFPQYAESIRSLLTRIVDLKKVIEETIYHPEFLGSYSIKKVVPVLLRQSVSTITLL
ncbi:MAG: hypothetical protein CK425_02610 [Parachlamydia sp.]|nr:MAG: hypothetical protein CK425_02610 [Parachlamydia sp.]